MSQYRKYLSNGNLLMYGFDHMTNNYFVSEFLPDDPRKEDYELEVFGISTTGMITTKDHPLFPGKQTFSNSEIAAILKEYGIVPEEHIQAIFMDLPI